MYYVLQNLDTFYVIDPSMIKLKEFKTFNEASEFCKYLNNQLEINQTNFSQFNSDLMYSSPNPQPFQTSTGLLQNQRFIYPTTSPGVTYGNITINCGGMSRAVPEVPIGNYDYQQFIPKNTNQSSQNSPEEVPPAIKLDEPKKTEPIKSSFSQNDDINHIKKAKENYLKDESLATAALLQKNDFIYEPTYELEDPNSFLTQTEINNFISKLE